MPSMRCAAAARLGTVVVSDRPGAAVHSRLSDFQ